MRGSTELVQNISNGFFQDILDCLIKNGEEMNNESLRGMREIVQPIRFILFV